MASFQKRGKVWQYTISNKPRPIRKSGFRTKKEAQIAASEIESGLQKGVAPHTSKELFADYFDSWLKIYKPDITGNTLARYTHALRMIEKHFEGKTIQDINKRSYQEFLNAYARTHAKATTQKLNTHIRACVRDAVDEGIIRIDFTRGAVIYGNDQEKRPEEKHLSFGDSKKLLQLLYDRLDRGGGYYLLLLGLTSGMRFAEMTGLTRKDFDFINNEIHINKTWGYMKQMHEGFGTTKNKQSARIIKMDNQTMSAFRDWFNHTPDNVYRLVFFSQSSKYHVLSNGHMNKLLKSLLCELDIEQSITVHGLRHSHASILLYQGVSIYYVSERLGHSDIETTNNHYAHIVKELRERDAEQTTKLFEDMAG